MNPQATKDLPHPFFSHFYAKVSPWMEEEGLADLRQELLVGLEGDVVEVGAGNGMNFAHYPPTVTRVIASSRNRICVDWRSRPLTKHPFP